MLFHGMLFSGVCFVMCLYHFPRVSTSSFLYTIQEEVANIAMNKYRKATAMIEEAEARADNAEKSLQTVRRSRSMSVSREVTRVIKM